jgi:hypothetical protein
VAGGPVDRAWDGAFAERSGGLDMAAERIILTGKRRARVPRPEPASLLRCPPAFLFAGLAILGAGPWILMR